MLKRIFNPNPNPNFNNNPNYYMPNYDLQRLETELNESRRTDLWTRGEGGRG